ncbi:hepatitis A virus cellular receptor 1 homolog isoform X1 [Triplophysa rosa]|uniref:Hepatitis A virus cellular receptor 2-like protein n=1 Tax=Triplophysa rosa TaxID=992332 RepID=A0A9W7TG82_TRIRA|nr:hepatitis A virus cellular receptor 1 homolog isoform X1 [Triplophysa rosa]KAI7796349.1 putative hepatitis A virus cellular receptor 2-like protein [Triplophysa rosa]
MVAFLFIITSSVLVSDCVESSLVFGRVGENITLPCKYDIDRHGILNICWGRHQSWFTCENTLISTDGLQVNYRETHRFSLAGRLDRGDVSLTIKGAKEKDAGLYVCRIEIPGFFNDASNTVYLFIRNGLEPKRVTQPAPTIAKQEKQVYYVFDPIRLTTDEYIRPETTNADVTDIHVGKAIAVVQTEETIETFVINAVRVGAIVFIPGLIIVLLFRLRLSIQQSRGRGIKTLTPSNQQSHSMNVE